MYNIKILTRSTFGNGTEHKESAQLTLNSVPMVNSFITINELDHIVKDIKYCVSTETNKSVLNQVIIYCDIC